ncbi:TlpA disulfide reductase family protein [Runella aurantiaca]|uniref:TlpA family protein disulfide reductase n=1 Tax=Runella aurantiaca TaxID=2282308 RepID=A0A369I692_9BACT|nr:TlpA disulfide reductase family protein [Runella aurantiaca]RDB03023.1 TlpA family protein disulfide reductase [Runella aurantiaca]
MIKSIGLLGAWLFFGHQLVQAQKVSVVKWKEIQDILSQSSDTTYIVNFWATWCKPCVAELPHFEEVQKNYKDRNVKVIMVSMDFAKDLTARVIPFVSQHQLTGKVWLLNEPDANNWIDKISTEWSGAIPATLIVNNQKKKKVFFEQKLDYDRLVKELSDFL